MSAQPSRSLAGLCSALLPTEAGGPDASELAQGVEELLATQPRAIGAAVRGGARAIDAASVLTSGRRLLGRDEAGRTALVERLARRGATAAGVDGLKALVLLAHGAAQAGPAALEAASGSPPARPDARLDVTPANQWPSRTSTSYVVVGSGAGGAMAARSLARAGAGVVVVEEGRRHVVEEFRSRPPLERFAALYRDAGTTAAIGRPPVMLPIGRGVGGTTLVNSGTCYRTPETVLRAWRDAAGVALADPDSFGRWLDDVWDTLAVSPVPLALMGRNGRLALAGAERLGWSSHPIARNAPGCGGCCQCSIGCPRNAKFGVHLNALPQACEAGARIVSEARAERLIVDKGRAVGVLARRGDGSPVVFEASEGVIVAAGATETPALLRRSGLGGHPRLGRNMAIHPAISVSGRFDEPVVAWRGVLQSAAVDEFHESRGILVEATSTPPGMGTMLLPDVGAALVEELRGADHLASLGAMVADLPAGRVIGKKRPLLVYRLTQRDASRLVDAIGVMGRILFAAGAEEVLTGVASHPRVRSEAELAEAVAAADPRSLHLAAFHPTGTAAAGRDPERYPVDERGALRGVTRAWVADGSVLPTCPEVNPQVSIMAFALAIAEEVAKG